MKILVFVKKFAAPTLTFIYNEVTELAKHNDVKIITLERINKEKFPFENVEVLSRSQHPLIAKLLHPFQTRDFLWSYRDKAIEDQVNGIISSFKPDVIHTHFGYESWWFLTNLKPQKIPVFISFHGFDASHKLNSKRYIATLKYFLKRHKLNPIFVSEYMAKTVEAKTGKLVDRDILYYGTDIEFFKKTNYEVPKSPFTFLQISSFAEKKGHEYTIGAFDSLLKLNLPFECRLILAGEGDLRVKMMELCKTLNIDKWVEFPGLVNSQEARNLMENAHVFVHHSITSNIGDKEGIPNALMEAMAMELPVISTIHSGIPELVQDGVNGYLVEEKDIKSYTDAMLKSLNIGLLKNNRNVIAEKFERKKHAEILKEFYKEKIQQAQN